MDLIQRKYGAAATIDGVTLITRAALDFKSNPALAAGDVQISKDGGAFANITTLPIVTPAAGTSVQVSLSATEMQAARVVVRFIDQTGPKEWEDLVLVIETYGNASAQHKFDLDTASSAQSGDSYARIGAPAGANVSADIAVITGRVPDYATGAVVNDAGNGSAQFKTDLADATNDVHKDKYIQFTSGTLSGQVKRVTAYNGTTKFLTVSTPFTATPSAADTFKFINE